MMPAGELWRSQERVSCPYSPESVEGEFCELRHDGVLRRLMRNCGRRGRSREFMLAPNLLPKAVPHDGSRLLPCFIVRPHRRLVEGKPPLGHTSPRPSRPPERLGGPDAGHPRPVASLSQREGLLALRMGAPAPLLPYVVLPRPTQPARPGPGGRVAPLAAGLRRGAF